MRLRKSYSQKLSRLVRQPTLSGVVSVSARRALNQKFIPRFRIQLEIVDRNSHRPLAAPDTRQPIYSPPAKNNPLILKTSPSATTSLDPGFGVNTFRSDCLEPRFLVLGTTKPRRPKLCHKPYQALEETPNLKTTAIELSAFKGGTCNGLGLGFQL